VFLGALGRVYCLEQLRVHLHFLAGEQAPVRELEYLFEMVAPWRDPPPSARRPTSVSVWMDVGSAHGESAAMRNRHCLGGV
jgi:hypothetical protein